MSSRFPAAPLYSMTNPCAGEVLNRRGILKGVQCVCGQWWPDFVRGETATQFVTECCGAVYVYSSGANGNGAFATLSLLTEGSLFSVRGSPVAGASVGQCASEAVARDQDEKCNMGGPGKL